MKHKRALSLFLSIVMIMMLAIETSAYMPAVAGAGFSTEAAEISTSAAECGRLEPDRSNTRSGFMLGSEPDSILYGAPEEIIIINEDGTETTILAANLNDFRSKKLFTRFDDGKASICTYDPETREIATMLESGSAEITHMFAINDEYIEYLAGNVVYRHYPDIGKSEKLAAPVDVFSFLPTSFGNFYSAGSSVDAELYFEGTHLLSGVSSYSVNDDMLYVTADYESYQIAVTEIASYCSAPTRSNLLDLMEPYEFYGLVPVCDILNMDDDYECAHCADGVEHVHEENNVEKTDENTVDYKGGTPMPLNDRQQQIVNRARPFVDFKWEPLATFTIKKGSEYEHTFVGGVESTGLPYSKRKYVGYAYFTNPSELSSLVGFKSRFGKGGSLNESFYTSMTRQSNGSYTTSDWPLYGLDCSAFVCYAWGVPKHGSGQYEDASMMPYARRIAGDGYNSLSNSQGLSEVDLNMHLMPGDAFVCANSHAILVTAVCRDDGNRITAITTMEETPPVAIEKTYASCQSLIARLKKNHHTDTSGFHTYSIYRLHRVDHSDDPTPTPAPTPTPTPASIPSTGYVQTQTDSLNLRDQANGTTILTKIPKGASFELFARTGDWFKACYNSKTGYVSAQYVAFAAKVKTNGGKLNLRATEEANSTVLIQIPNGTELLVWNLKNGRYQTEYGGETGYVSATFIELKNGQKVTVTLQPKGSVVSPSTITVAVGQKYGTLPEPAAREGYLFTGWYLGGTKITANSSVQNSSNHILTGKWKYIGSASPQSIVPDELINKIGNSIIEGE